MKSCGKPPSKCWPASRSWLDDLVRSAFAKATADNLRVETRAEVGAGTRTRTEDLLITNQLLYQLSYAGPAWTTFKS